MDAERHGHWGTGCPTGAPRGVALRCSVLLLGAVSSQDVVKYPENISPACKSFLKGLLNKTASQRLDWSTGRGSPAWVCPSAMEYVRVEGCALWERAPFSMSGGCGGLSYERPTSNRSHVRTDHRCKGVAVGLPCPIPRSPVP